MPLTSSPLPMPGEASPPVAEVVAMTSLILRCCFRPYRRRLEKLEPPARQKPGRWLSWDGDRSALQELQDLLRQLIRLRDHRGRGLLQHLGARQVGGFRGEVGV